VDLILIGCEYVGTTTLAVAINQWAEKAMGVPLAFHDHWKYPVASGHPPHETITNLTEEEMRQLLDLTPKLREVFTRYTLYYHTPSQHREGPGSILAGHYFDEAIYGPPYFGYGGRGEPGDRGVVLRDVERRIMTFAPDTVLVLVKASPEVIASRMKENPHRHGVVPEKDIERVLDRFEEEFESSLIGSKLALDTSDATVGETVAEFVRRVEPHLTEADRLRMLTRGAL
jgi:hypothetical protein